MTPWVAVCLGLVTGAGIVAGLLQVRKAVLHPRMPKYWRVTRTRDGRTWSGALAIVLALLLGACATRGPVRSPETPKESGAPWLEVKASRPTYLTPGPDGQPRAAVSLTSFLRGEAPHKDLPVVLRDADGRIRQGTVREFDPDWLCPSTSWFWGDETSASSHMQPDCNDEAPPRVFRPTAPHVYGPGQWVARLRLYGRVSGEQLLDGTVTVTIGGAQ